MIFTLYSIRVVAHDIEFNFQIFVMYPHRAYSACTMYLHPILRVVSIKLPTKVIDKKHILHFLIKSI